MLQNSWAFSKGIARNGNNSYHIFEFNQDEFATRKHLKLTAALLDLILECHSAVEEMSETPGKLIDKCNRP